MESHTENKFWIRPEDADHPKLDRLRRAIIVDVGPADDVSFPGLSGEQDFRERG